MPRGTTRVGVAREGVAGKDEMGWGVIQRWGRITRLWV